jgi:hypothetical protein
MDRSAASLAGWTPVALSAAAGELAIDWGDLRGVRFAEPFLHQTIERWAGGDPAPLVRSGGATLAALDSEPSLDPAAIVFHVSRCGSTLLARLMRALPGVLVVSEAAPVNSLLLAGDMATPSSLRLLVRALGRKRFADETRFVLKLSSWNVRRAALFRSAFPEARFIWLQRAPEAVLASLLADPPGWFALRHDAAAARALFGIEDPAPDEASFAIRALAALYEAARAFGPDLVLDYADLPAAAWTLAAPMIGLVPGAEDLARLEREASFVAKDATPRPFAAHAPARRLPDHLRDEVADSLAPLHAALARRKAGGRDFAGAARL